MRALEVTLEVRGLSVERGLQRAAEAGVRLLRVRRVDARTVRLCVQAQDEAALTQALRGMGYGVTCEREALIRRAARTLRRRVLLGLGGAVCVLMVFAAGTRVWSVDIHGAGASEGEVRRILCEAGAARGQRRARIDAQAIEETIERQLPDVKYVSVQLRGMRLDVHCAQAKNAAEAESGGEAGHLYAAKDGIITQMIVRSGTPKARVGDAVFAGQLLVEGFERGANGENVPVPAHAQITAQTFYEGSACVRAWTIESTQTGRNALCTRIKTPWGEWGAQGENPFALSDAEKTVLPAGGGLFPVFYVRETIHEAEGEKIARPREALEDESTKIAAQIAGRNIPIGAEVVDKWVDYSMIEKGFCARVILVCREDIAAAQTISP